MIATLSGAAGWLRIDAEGSRATTRPLDDQGPHRRSSGSLRGEPSGAAEPDRKADKCRIGGELFRGFELAGPTSKRRPPPSIPFAGVLASPADRLEADRPGAASALRARASRWRAAVPGLRHRARTAAKAYHALLRRLQALDLVRQTGDAQARLRLSLNAWEEAQEDLLVCVLAVREAEQTAAAIEAGVSLPVEPLPEGGIERLVRARMLRAGAPRCRRTMRREGRG